MCVYVCARDEGAYEHVSVKEGRKERGTQKVSSVWLLCKLFHISVSAVLVVEWPLVGGVRSVLTASGDSPFTLGFSGVSGGGLRGATDTRVLPWFSWSTG